MQQPLSPPSRAQVDTIREELRALGEIGSREKEVSRNFASQTSNLKRDIALLTRQIDFESERHKEVRRLIQLERKDTVPEDHLSAINRRDEEIRAIREEKEAMLEWLQRGVNEAQKMSMTLETLKAGSTQTFATQNDLVNDKRRLAEMERRLSAEIEDAKAKIQRLSDARSALSEHTDQQTSLLSLTKEIVDSAVNDKERLQSEVERLQARARDLETIEVATSCMAASVRRCLHTLETLNDAIAKGVLMEDLPDDDGYDSDEDADPTRSTTVVLSSTKAKIGRCDALLLTLRSVLKRYDQEIASRTAHAAQALRFEKQAYVEEQRVIAQQIDAELSRLRSLATSRDHQLRNALDLHTRAVANYFGDAGSPTRGGDEAPFSLVDYYQRENEKLALQQKTLAEENVVLEAKVRERSTDYDAVRELRHEYRELESKRMVLASSLKQAEAENTQLRVGVFELEVAMPLKSKQRPPWRGVPLT